jgi:RNAse (barnase) inhibitor barstar
MTASARHGRSRLSSAEPVLDSGGYVKVVIDGRFVLNAADLHRRMAGAFGYGPFYEHDLDSLRDQLGGGDPRPLELVWIYAQSIRMALGTAAYDRFVAILEQIEGREANKDWSQRFVFRLFD